ncbi:VOC family protein [Marinoscillum sp.]|uniref:VOC family protein n=1 Tax=Marinoscillum sp. TaxID=2024838 RepID=UPI003BADA4F8
MKKSIIILLLLVCFEVSAQNYQPKVKTDHIAIVVTDLSKSAQFYAEILGLGEITNQTKKSNIRWFSFADGVELHLIQTSKEGIQTKKDLHLAVAVDNLPEFMKMLQAKRIPFESWQGESGKSNSRPDGVNQVYIRDPDGYWIEVNDAKRF